MERKKTGRHSQGMTVAARGISNQYTQVLGDTRQRLYQAAAEICSDF